MAQAYRLSHKWVTEQALHWFNTNCFLHRHIENKYTQYHTGDANLSIVKVKTSKLTFLRRQFLLVRDFTTDRLRAPPVRNRLPYQALFIDEFHHEDANYDRRVEMKWMKLMNSFNSTLLESVGQASFRDNRRQSTISFTPSSPNRELRIPVRNIRGALPLRIVKAYSQLTREFQSQTKFK